MNERELNLDRLVTKHHREDLVALDLMTTTELVELMNGQDATVPAAVATAREQIATAIDGIAERLARGGRLIYVGAGTPGRLAVLDAAECGPTFNAAPEQIQAVLAGGEQTLVPVSLLGDRTAEAEREIRDRLNSAHGYRPLGP